jgi:hypothetical protein
MLFFLLHTAVAEDVRRFLTAGEVALLGVATAYFGELLQKYTS